MTSTMQKRRVQRIHLAQPLVARLGTTPVVVVDLSLLGARIEHHMPLQAGGSSRLSFQWEGREIEANCRIVRSRLERFSVGADGLTVFHSGLEFQSMPETSKGDLKTMLTHFIARALEEQKLNARGILPQHDVAKMPIFRHGGMLTANQKDVAAAIGGSVMPLSRMQKDAGYVSYLLEGSRWRKKRTPDPVQPLDGFTISANEDDGQAELLCEAYVMSDREGRRMIRMFAELSIMDGAGVEPGRFEP